MSWLILLICHFFIFIFLPYNMSDVIVQNISRCARMTFCSSSMKNSTTDLLCRSAMWCSILTGQSQFGLLILSLQVTIWAEKDACMTWLVIAAATCTLLYIHNLRWLNTVFDTGVTFTFFSKTLGPLVTKNGSKQVNNINSGFFDSVARDVNMSASITINKPLKLF